MASATNLLRLLVILLGFCNLLSSINAVPNTRIGRLFVGVGVLPVDDQQVSSNAHMSGGEKNLEEDQVVVLHGRMAVELNDYPGSGANNRHTPRPQFGRGCVDC